MDEDVARGGTIRCASVCPNRHVSTRRAKFDEVVVSSGRVTKALACEDGGILRRYHTAECGATSAKVGESITAVSYKPDFTRIFCTNRGERNFWCRSKANAIVVSATLCRASTPRGISQSSRGRIDIDLSVSTVHHRGWIDLRVEELGTVVCSEGVNPRCIGQLSVHVATIGKVVKVVHGSAVQPLRHVRSSDVG